MSNEEKKVQSIDITNSEDKKSNKPTTEDSFEETMESRTEVRMQLETDTYESIGVQDNIKENNNTLGEKKDIRITSSNDGEDLSNLSVEISSQNANEILAGKEKIIIDQETLGNREEESTIKTVTSLSIGEGNEIEVQTEIQVPIDDKNKKTESESKIKVKSDVDEDKEIPVS